MQCPELPGLEVLRIKIAGDLCRKLCESVIVDKIPARLYMVRWMACTLLLNGVTVGSYMLTLHFGWLAPLALTKSKRRAKGTTMCVEVDATAEDKKALAQDDAAN